MACYPNDKKFMFRISNISPGAKYSTIKSLKTGMFLVSDRYGKASMEEIKDLSGGQPMDRRTWFELFDNDDDHGDNDMTTDTTMTIISKDITFREKTCEVEVIRAAV